MSSTLRLPPIIIPSSGRAETALLDLRETIPEDEVYIQIVVIRHEECSSYARVMNHPDHNIDVFVMKEAGSAKNYRLSTLCRQKARQTYNRLLQDGLCIPDG